MAQAVLGLFGETNKNVMTLSVTLNATVASGLVKAKAVFFLCGIYVMLRQNPVLICRLLEQHSNSIQICSSKLSSAV